MRTEDSRPLNQMLYRPPGVEERLESEYHTMANSFLAYVSRAATCFAAFAASALRGAFRRYSLRRFAWYSASLKSQS